MGFFGGGGGGGTVGPGTTNTAAKFTAADEVGDSLITEASGRDNVPALSGGVYNADFFSGPQSGWELTATQLPGNSRTPNGLLAVVDTSDDGFASASGAVIGAFDQRTSGNYGSVIALNIDTIKTGAANALALVGISGYVWNQAGGTIGQIWGVNMSVEGDGGHVTGDVITYRAASPFLPSATVDGRVVGLYLANQTATATGGAYAIYYDAPGDNIFSVAADGHLQVGATITPPATTGAQAINKNAGSVNFAAVASSLVVTCDKCTANSLVIATVATNDATLKSVQAVAGSGSFTLFGNAAATAETRVNFWILNQ